MNPAQLLSAAGESLSSQLEELGATVGRDVSGINDRLADLETRADRDGRRIATLEQVFGTFTADTEKQLKDLERRVTELEGPLEPEYDVVLDPSMNVNKVLRDYGDGVKALFSPGVYRQPITNPPGGSLLVAEGDVLIAPEGTEFCIDIQYESSSNVTMRGFRCDASRVQYDALKLQHSFRGVGDSPQDCIFEDMQFFGATGPSNGVITVEPSRGHIFRRCKSYNNGDIARSHGWYIASSNILCEECSSFDNRGWGFHVFKQQGPIYENKIHRCEAYDNGKSGQGFGIILSRGFRHEAIGNWVWGNRQGGIQVDLAVAECRIAGNTLYRKNGIFRGREQDCVYENNVQLDIDAPTARPLTRERE